MYECVSSIFPSFSKEFEGRVRFMYLDFRGLVTIGIGNLIDPVAEAVGLPFMHKSNGIAATHAEIEGEWRLLKNQPMLAHQGPLACEEITHLRLPESAIDKLVRTRLGANEALLRKRFTEWDQWPADAQLGVLSMAWALGAGFPSKWPNFAAAAKARNWASAAEHCRIREEGNPGIKPRNDADQLLFNNAAVIERHQLNKAELFYRKPLPQFQS